jgi:hypothetical protein
MIGKQQSDSTKSQKMHALLSSIEENPWVLDSMEKIHELFETEPGPTTVPAPPKDKG